MLGRTPGIKEAYGATYDGVQFVCVVLQDAVPLDQIKTIPYVYGLLPPNQVPIRTTNFHLVAYTPRTPTDDPILHALKKPSDRKWMWIAPPKPPAKIPTDMPIVYKAKWHIAYIRPTELSSDELSTAIKGLVKHTTRKSDEMWSCLLSLNPKKRFTTVYEMLQTLLPLEVFIEAPPGEQPECTVSHAINIPAKVPMIRVVH